MKEVNLEDLCKIKRMIKFCIPVIRFDEEALASDIWLELWEKKAEVSWTHVRNRCIDTIRHLTNVHFESISSIPEDAFTSREEDELNELDAKDLLDTIVSRTTLSNEDEELLYRKFYQNTSTNELSFMFGITPRAVNLRLQSILERLKRSGRTVIEELVEKVKI